jgi:serine/threonine protein kinase/tetratricopeptide (TPR) repeat protein
MPNRFRCPRGHEWEDHFGDAPSFVDGLLVCPVCGLVSGDGLIPASNSFAPGAIEPCKTLETPLAAEPCALPPAAERPALRPGPVPVLPGYEILQELGRGGMGVVYKARQLGLNRLVALKMVIGGPQAGERQLARFRAEGEAVARLHHPNIVQIYEVGQHDGHPFFSLEFVEGGTLADRIVQGPLGAREAAELIETLARAMHYAHERGVVHRDLKPANILLTATAPGSRDSGASRAPSSSPETRILPIGLLPKITDFGLAKQLDRVDSNTKSGTVVGTPYYMAPEQAGGKGERVGPCTDIHALGAMLYEMVTGRPPFLGCDPITILYHVAHDEPNPPTRYNTRTPRDLEIIILKCLQKQPSQRYATALDLADDLRRFLEHEPIKARATSTWERGIRWMRRRPAAAGLAAGLLVAALTVAVVAAVHWRSDVKRRDDFRREVSDQLTKVESAADMAHSRDDWRRVGDMLAPIEQKVELPDFPAELREKVTSVRGRIAAEDLHREFFRRHDEALFLAGAENFHGLRSKAQAALQMVGMTDNSSTWARGNSFSDEQADQIGRGCYELLLALAEADAAEKHPDTALTILDRAAGLGSQTKAYHLRRARYLRLANKSVDALAEEQLAQTRRADSAFDHFLVGQEYFNRGELKEALQAFDAALHDRSLDDYWISYYKALCHVRLGQYDLARENLTRCLTSRSDVVWPYSLRGFVYGQCRRYVEAEADFRTALAILDREDDVQLRYVVLNDLAIVRSEQKKHALAEADLRAAVSLKPTQYNAYATLAQVLERSGRLPEALDMIDRAVRVAQEDEAGVLAQLYRARAQLRAKKGGNIDEVVFDLRLAAHLDPEPAGQARAVAECGHLLVREHQFARAVAAYTEALALAPGHPDWVLARAECFVELGRGADAVREYDRYLQAKVEPAPSVFAGRALARLRQDMPDRDGAVADLTLALARKPGETSYLAKRAELLLENREYSTALNDYDELLRRNERTPAVLLGRAQALVQLGRHADAAAGAEEALQLGHLRPIELHVAGSVFARAAGCLDRPVDSTEMKTRRTYQQRAVQLLRRSLNAVPDNNRADFWITHTGRDRALASVRGTEDFRALEREFAPPRARSVDR